MKDKTLKGLTACYPTTKKVNKKFYSSLRLDSNHFRNISPKCCSLKAIRNKVEFKGHIHDVVRERLTENQPHETFLITFKPPTETFLKSVHDWERIQAIKAKGTTAQP